MSKHILPIAITFLSIAIFFLGFQIWNYTSNNKAENQSYNQNEFSSSNEVGLLTIEQAANYLNLTKEDLEILIKNQDTERSQAGEAFLTYQFIPYIKINEERYFSKADLNEWIKFNTISWKYIRNY